MRGKVPEADFGRERRPHGWSSISPGRATGDAAQGACATLQRAMPNYYVYVIGPIYLYSQHHSTSGLPTTQSIARGRTGVSIAKTGKAERRRPIAERYGSDSSPIDPRHQFNRKSPEQMTRATRELVVLAQSVADQIDRVLGAEDVAHRALLTECRDIIRSLITEVEELKARERALIQQSETKNESAK